MAGRSTPAQGASDLSGTGLVNSPGRSRAGEGLPLEGLDDLPAGVGGVDHDQADQHVPTDGDEAGLVLSYARAHVLRTTEEHGRIADSIVRTSGWPGATDLIDALAHEAVQLALGHRANIDVESDNDEVIDTVQRRLMPDDDTFIVWIRDPAFATVIDPIGSARNGAEMLSQAADWLTWSVSRDAVEAVRAMLMPPAAAG